MKTERKKLIDKLDKLVSEIARTEQSECEKCGKPAQGVHHYFSRSKQSTRWDFDNLVVLCWAHHLHWAHKYPEDCRDYLISRIGQNCFDKLKRKANHPANFKIYDLTEMISNFQRRLRDLNSY